MNKKIFNNRYTLYSDGRLQNNATNKFLTAVPTGRSKKYLVYGTKPITYVHKLVAEHFVDGEGDVVRHKNGDTFDNDYRNLEWCSFSESKEEWYKKNRRKRKKRFYLPRNEREKNMVRLYDEGLTYKEIGNEIGLTEQRVGRIMKGIER